MLAISSFGWRGCASIGILIELIFIFFLPNLITWVDEGSIELDSSLMEENQTDTTDNFEASFVKDQLDS
jgi:hypothetical protein